MTPLAPSCQIPDTVQEERIIPRLSSQRAAALLVLAFAGIVFCAHALRYRDYLIDDAFISMRYARNLVEGHGLVFNPGERVEGYTNLLWVLLAAAAMKAGAAPVLTLKVVSVLAAAGTLLVVHRLQRSEDFHVARGRISSRAGMQPLPRSATGGPTAASEGSTAASRRPTAAGGDPITTGLATAGAIPAVLWLLPLEVWGYWSTAMMETMLFAAGFTFAVHLSLLEGREGRRRGSLPIFLLLSLLRPEGALCFVLSHLAVVVDERVRGGVWTLRRHVVDGAAFAAFGLIWMSWRFAYYGRLLPNTYTAKVTGGVEQWRAGVHYLALWARAEPVFALVLLAAAVVCLVPRLRRIAGGSEIMVLGTIALGYAGYVVAIGGDFMPFHRFLLPILPLCAVLSSRFIALAAGQLRLGAAGALAAVAILAGGQAIAGMRGDDRFGAFISHRVTAVGLRVGRYFAQTLDRRDLIALNAVGSLPYESRLPAIDMLGLTDAAIAHHASYVISEGYVGHRRGWGDYVLSRRPRVVIWCNSAGSDEPLYLGDRQLAEDPFFRFFYQLRRVPLPDPLLSASPGSAAPEPPVLARFYGSGAARGISGSTLARDLGARFETREGLISETLAFESPVTVTYLEFRLGQASLWPLREASGGDIDRFLDAVLETWARARDSAAPIDASARREVDALCDQALERIESGKPAEAKEILERAVSLNANARSPLVYQYIANLAVVEGSVFLAVQAQAEALRLDPANALYRANLKSLLTLPYEKLRAGRALPPPS